MDHFVCLYFFLPFKPHFPRTGSLKPNNILPWSQIICDHEEMNSEIKAVGNNMAVSIKIFCFVVESLVHLVFVKGQQ